MADKVSEELLKQHQKEMLEEEETCSEDEDFKCGHQTPNHSLLSLSPPGSEHLNNEVMDEAKTQLSSLPSNENESDSDDAQEGEEQAFKPHQKEMLEEESASQAATAVLEEFKDGNRSPTPTPPLSSNSNSDTNNENEVTEPSSNASDAQKESEDLEITKDIKISDFKNIGGFADLMKGVPPKVLAKIASAPIKIDQSEDIEQKGNADDASSSSTSNQQLSSESAKSLKPAKPPKKYSREEILKLKKTRTIEEWTDYLWKNHGDNWNVAIEPFEMDAELRGPIFKQIRVSRKREEQLRQWASVGKEQQQAEAKAEASKARSSSPTSVLAVDGLAIVDEQHDAKPKENQPVKTYSNNKVQESSWRNNKRAGSQTIPGSIQWPTPPPPPMPVPIFSGQRNANPKSSGPVPPPPMPVPIFSGPRNANPKSSGPVPIFPPGKRSVNEEKLVPFVGKRNANTESLKPAPVPIFPSKRNASTEPLKPSPVPIFSSNRNSNTETYGSAPMPIFSSGPRNANMEPLGARKYGQPPTPTSGQQQQKKNNNENQGMAQKTEGKKKKHKAGDNTAEENKKALEKAAKKMAKKEKKIKSKQAKADKAEEVLKKIVPVDWTDSDMEEEEDEEEVDEILMKHEEVMMGDKNKKKKLATEEGNNKEQQPKAKASLNQQVQEDQKNTSNQTENYQEKREQQPKQKAGTNQQEKEEQKQNTRNPQDQQNNGNCSSNYMSGGFPMPVGAFPLPHEIQLQVNWINSQPLMQAYMAGLQEGFRKMMEMSDKDN